MLPRRLLLFANSRMLDTTWLEWCIPYVLEFLGPSAKVLFIPFAEYDCWDAYTDRVQKLFPDYEITGLHKSTNMRNSIKSAEAIMVGGGNAYFLMHQLYRFNVLEFIREQVLKHTIPYVGWGAGAVAACPDLKGSTDIPIAWPRAELAINIFPYNLFPHYNASPYPQIEGECLDYRITDCFRVNRSVMIGLPDGTGVLVEGEKLIYIRSNHYPNIRVKFWIPSKVDEPLVPKIGYVMLIDQRSEPVDLETYIY